MQYEDEKFNSFPFCKKDLQPYIQILLVSNVISGEIAEDEWKGKKTPEKWVK